jgi:hypothetical protein
MKSEVRLAALDQIVVLSDAVSSVLLTRVVVHLFFTLSRVFVRQHIPHQSKITPVDVICQALVFAQEDNLANSEKKTGEDDSTGFPKLECSLTILSCGENRIRTCDRCLHTDNRLAGGPNRPLWHLPVYTCLT